ncbi:hypothetical protein [Marinobacter sp.]|jgi:hypothetical protein|uniref:hypothetical protein n=1 Tax=Marinobacter sp. TaxID=50741 RepID=UPI000C8995F7|nr:hypothetical protein [Marinobacter sp.]MAB50250.1 hypothetical protein [Marinobacter sp.]|tara:strand:+ start:2166 stop:3875 length:1710 start_codon:yes stop_codon:yes gene_type:complete
MPEDLKLVVDAEIEAALTRAVSQMCELDDPVQWLGEYVETLYKKGAFSQAQGADIALEILIPKVLKRKDPTGSLRSTGSSFNLEAIANSISVAMAYYQLRDYIYISFTENNAIEWQILDQRLLVSVKDLSIFRQLCGEIQVFFINSSKVENKGTETEDLVELLAGTKQFDLENENVAKSLDIIEKETKWKLGFLYDHLPSDSKIQLDGYNYSEFYKVYNELLEHSIYQRYYSLANNLSSVITYSEDELVNATESAFGIGKSLCRKILIDIAASSRSSFIWVPSKKKFLLFPFSFSLKDGLSGILKKFAKDHPNKFSSSVAVAIGNSLVERLSDYFKPFSNFRCLTEINLQKYSSDLPDIDLLAISYEPSLGFHIFVCEAKNNLPASWAKEHLKARGKDGYVEKALSQSKKINKFLRTKPGVDLIYSIIKKHFSHLDFERLFPTGFSAVYDFVIITSQNLGMFFPNAETSIINEDMFKHIIDGSDGDVCYIQNFLRNMNETLDSCYDVKTVSIDTDHYQIEYEVAQLSKILQIERTQYLSVGALEDLEHESLSTGGHFVDMLSDPRGGKG